MRCKVCGHFTANHKIKVHEFYEKNYSIISHGNDLRKKFNKLLSLKSKSDNHHRVRRILSKFKNLKTKEIKLLDVGSGLGIFLYQLKKKSKLESNRN